MSGSRPGLCLLAASAVLTALVVVTPRASSAAGAEDCGFWRWDAKTLAGPSATKVDYQPRRTTVSFLRSLRPPGNVFAWSPYKSRTKGVERRTYRVAVHLLRMVREADHDIHLVVASPEAKSKTMIVEFPDVHCSGAASSGHKEAMRRARNALLADCGPVGSSFVSLKGSATVTGVGFWDERHGQSGVAPNGIELHPALNYRGSCSKASFGGSSGGGTGGGGSGCTPGYSPCLRKGPSDYDCSGGGGDGPAYTKPGVTYHVPDSDPYRLDSDGDGLGCE